MRALLVAALAGVAACSAPQRSTVGGGGGSGGAMPPLTAEDQALLALPKGADQLAVVCGRGHRDAVLDGLCRPGAQIHSLKDLQSAVHLFDGPRPPQLALTGHSTSLVERTVSSINPRAIIFTAPSQPPTTQANDGSFVADPGFVAMGFARGEQFVELIAHDAQADALDFYLVRFRQKCNASGCRPGDLYTPAVESGWTDLTVYEDEDLKNTLLDCRHCHQPDGPGTRKMLRMQERRAPWTHWFRNNLNEPGGVSLLADFLAAHDGEDYAGIPAQLLSTPRNDPLVLEALVDNNSISPQPNEFNGARIEREVKQSAPAQPDVNDPMGDSPTWQQIRRNAVAGRAIPVPYHDVKVTDAGKLARATEAYRRVRAGGDPAMLPELSDVLLSAGLADMGLQPTPGLDGGALLVEMCARCHNQSLDQGLSRARFDATRLAEMSRAEKDAAIQRLMLSDDTPLKMPPTRFSRLSPDDISRAVTFLEQ